MGLLAASNSTYYTFSEEPVSGSLETDRRASNFLKRLKESSWMETYAKELHLESLNMNVHLAALLMFASIPKETLSEEEYTLIQKSKKMKQSKCFYLICPSFFLVTSSILTSASIGLCYFFTKDAVPLNPVKMTIIFSVTALVSLVASQVFMYFISARRASQLAELNVQELSMWDRFEQNTVKPTAREWLKLFDAKALPGESHSKFQTRRKMAMVIYERVDLDEMVKTFQTLTSHHDKISHIFSHFKEVKNILERQIAFEALHVEIISQDYMHYNITGSDMGLYAASLNYFKTVSNRWEI
jgi:hypothetical protein